MTEVEHNIAWPETGQHAKGDHLSFEQAYAETGQNDITEDFADIPMIIVESNQETDHSDAPIVIYPNDPSVVGAEEIVQEEEQGDISWGMHPIAKEEEVVPMNDDYYEHHTQKYLTREDFSDIPLNDESYATFHPFPCDFCARRFKKKANLINHMVAHQTQRPHCCTICSSRFMRKCDLVNHQKIHAYIPNRDNRDDLDADPGYMAATQRKVTRRRKSSNAGRKRSVRDPSLSPDANQYNIKPSSYVDEDVKLLLEMTSKLHESRKSESDVGGPSSVVEPQARSSGTDGKPYVCSKCNRCFARESAMISHSQVHAEDSSHDCNKCGSRFFTIDLLKDHYSKKHDILYTADSSDDSEQEKGDSKGWYTGDERFGTFYCDLCDQSFHRMDALRQHKRLHSKKDDYSGLYSCSTCQSMFLTNEKLLEHLDVSINCQKHVCLLCAEQFSNQAQVKVHIHDMHTHIPPHTCTICGKQCRDSKYLKKHYLTHVSNKRRAGAPSSSKMWSCDECDESFHDKRSLSYHKGTHYTRSNSQRRFLCNECGKSFSSRSSQQIHNRIHTGERPYGCRYCWKAFADGGTLRKHERIHTGEKPYVCAVCPRAFNQRVVLREHIRSHHSGSVSKIGYSTPVYVCPVCELITAGSDELALHIVKHSDDNTVRNRAPPTSARAFRRRKKPEPAPADCYRMSEFEEADFFDNRNSDTESVESEEKKETPRKKTGGARRTNSYTKFSKAIDAAMKNIASLVDQKPVRKAKMINSKIQTGGKVAVGKRGVKKRGKRGGESNRAVVTVIKPRVRTLSGRLSGRRSSLVAEEEKTETPAEEEGEELAETKSRYGRPRTKNVNYETLRALNQGLPSATFPEVKVEGQIKIERGAENIKEEVSENDSYVCGICSVVFNSKADLLFHVPVHI